MRLNFSAQTLKSSDPERLNFSAQKSGTLRKSRLELLTRNLKPFCSTCIQKTSLEGRRTRIQGVRAIFRFQVFWTTKFGQPSEPEPEPDFPNLKYPTKNPDIRPIRPKIAWHSPQDTPTQTPVPQRPQTHPRAQQWLFSIPANSLNFIRGLPAQPVAPSHRNSVGVPAVGFRGPPSSFSIRSPANS